MAPLWIMVAGPYGTNATPERRAANLTILNAAALEVWKKGHVPVIGVNNARPMIEVAGEEHYEALMMPLSLALTQRCDAVLRIGGASNGADREVEAIRALGRQVFTNLSEIPQVG